MDDAPVGRATLREPIARRLPDGRTTGERRYRTLWSVSPECLFTIEARADGEFRTEALNPALERLTGLLTEDVAGKPLEEVLPATAAETLNWQFRNCVNAGRPTSYEIALELPGGLRHWEVGLTPMRDHGGRIAWLLGSARDVTERDSLRDALSESEAKFRALAEMAPDIIFSATGDGQVIYRNPRYYEYTGLEPEADSPLFDMTHPEDRARLEGDRLTAPDSAGLTAELRIRGADGTYRWFLLRASRLETTHGVRWFGVETDIHEVKIAAESQRRLNAQLESVLSSISDCYYTIDRNWRITRANPQTAAWFDAPVENLVGKDARKVLRFPPDMFSQIADALATGTPNRGEHEAAYRPDRFIDAAVYPNAEGASVFFRDVTEEHRARREVEDAHGFLQATVDALSAQVAILDETGVITAVNQAWCDFVAEVFPDVPNQGLGLRFQEHSAAALGREGARVRNGVLAVLAGRKPSFTYTYARGQGFYQVLLRRFVHQGGTHIVVTQEDITEATVAQRSLRESAERLLDLQEEERRRMAVELHDSTGQHLVALSLAIGAIQRITPETAATTPLFQDIRSSLDEAQRELRVFSYLLHPPYLEEAGLARSLHTFVSGFAKRSGLRVIERISDKIDVADLGVRRTAFRIVQEALSNVHRHAHATSVIVEARADKQLRLTVVDNGRGFPADVEDRAGVGVAGMRARVAQFGGQFSIASAAKGVSVKAVLPLAGP